MLRLKKTKHLLPCLLAAVLLVCSIPAPKAHAEININLTVMSYADFCRQNVEDLKSLAQMALNNGEYFGMLMDDYNDIAETSVRAFAAGSATDEQTETAKQALYDMYVQLCNILSNSKGHLTPILRRLSVAFFSWNDFVSWLANKPLKAFKLYSLLVTAPVWSPLAVSKKIFGDILKSKGTSNVGSVVAADEELEISSEMVNTMKTCIDGYITEKNGYYLVKSITLDDINIMYFDTTDRMERFKDAVGSYFDQADFDVVAFKYPYSYAYSFAFPKMDTVALFMDGRSNPPVVSTVFSDYTFDTRFFYIKVGSSGVYSGLSREYFDSLPNKSGTSALYSKFSELEDGTVRFITPDGSSVKVYKDLDSYKLYSVGQQLVYYGDSYVKYDSSVDNSFKVTGDYIQHANVENDYSTIQQTINQSGDTITETTVNNIVNNYYITTGDPGSGGSGSGSGSGSESGGGSSDWLQMIVDGFGKLLSGVASVLGLIIGFIGDLLTLASDMLGKLKDSIASLSADFSGFTDFLAATFTFIPPEIWSVVSLGMTAAIIVLVIGAFRK